MIERLALPLRRGERAFKLTTKKRCAGALVRLGSDSHPNEMNMVTHHGVYRTNKILTNGRVEADLPERTVPRSIKPPGRPVLRRVCPEDNCIATVVFGRKAREMTPGHDSLVTSAATGSKLVSLEFGTHRTP